MEGLTVRTDLARRPSKTTSLTHSSAWNAMSKPFQSKPKLAAGVMSSWVEKQNEEALAQHKRIFYMPGLTSIAKSSEAVYTQLPSRGRWEFKGIPVLTVNPDMPPTGSELDLRTEMDFWETVVPDKSQRPKEVETPAVLEKPDVLFDADDEPKEDEDEDSDYGLIHINELHTVSPRPLSPTGAQKAAEMSHGMPQRQMVFQPQTTLNPDRSRPQSGRILLSTACTFCGLGSMKARREEEKS